MIRVANFEKVSEEQYKKDYENIYKVYPVPDSKRGRNLAIESAKLYSLIRLPKRATKGSAGYDFFTPEDIKLKSNQEEYQFVASVNTYKGYFKNKNGNVQYVVIDEGKWSEAYTKQMEYEDKNRR